MILTIINNQLTMFKYAAQEIKQSVIGIGSSEKNKFSI
ncbi:MAG: crossover junction endodeoxyribonuclease RuvC [Arsenophonus sp. NC-PE1-MAG3]